MVKLDKIKEYEHRLEIQEILTIFEDTLEVELNRADIEFMSNRFNELLNRVEDKARKWPRKDEWSTYDEDYNYDNKIKPFPGEYH